MKNRLVSLMERVNGVIRKNESYTYQRLKKKIYMMNYEYFNHWWYGYGRMQTVNRIFKTFDELIDMDEEGKHRVDFDKNPPE
jgi:hypothetical protein